MATRDDDPAVLGRVLDALESEPLAHPVVLVDMSEGDEIRALTEARDVVRHVAFPESGGLSESRNRVLAETATRYLLFVDADAIPQPGWAAAMRGGFHAEPEAAVVGARCLPEWSRRPPPLFGTAPALDFLGMLDLGPEPLEVPRIVGTSFALDRERLPPGDAPFSTELGRKPGSVLGFEEVDLCLTVRRHGWRVRYEPGAMVRHVVRSERLSWRWMQRRAYTAGRESRHTARRLEPMPRRLHVLDRAFQVAIAPSFVAGRMRGVDPPSVQ